MQARKKPWIGQSRSDPSRTRRVEPSNHTAATGAAEWAPREQNHLFGYCQLRTLAGVPQLTSAASNENAPVTGPVAAPPPRGAQTTTSQCPAAPDQSNLYAVLDYPYPGRDCVAMRATHHSLESAPSKHSQPSKLPACPASPSHFAVPTRPCALWDNRGRLTYEENHSSTSLVVSIR